jgi:CubicO group peptidase (beta-lactamase class C family)
VKQNAIFDTKNHQAKENDVGLSLKYLSAILGSLVFTSALAADLPGQPETAMATVSAAQHGYTPQAAYEHLKNYNYEEVLKSGDVALFFLLNFNNKLGTATIPRAGNVAMLGRQADPAIPALKIKGEFGDLTLARYLDDPRSRAQGIIVIHKGKIVFEQYPGMRDFDSHLWMSVTKTAAALVIGQLVEAGKIDVKKPIDDYLPELKQSDWAGISVQNVLDMATGLDNVESQAACH